MTKFVGREWVELISDPITLGKQDQRVFEHAGLPTVKNKLSITLRLKIHKRSSDLTTIFVKGYNGNYTPALWLTINKSALNLQFTDNWDSNVGIRENKWYHLTYTLSDPKKRLDLYVDGEWVGFYCIQSVKTQKFIFNDGPLYIGYCLRHNGFDGEISNVRYFNWRLSAEEVKEDFFNGFQKKPIVYGSKIALVHVPTRKYLSTKGIGYDLGSNNKQQMVICSGQEINLKDDVWIVIGANGTSVNAGCSVSVNTIIGFKHQTTEKNLHSHDTNNGRVTPISKQQQVTLCNSGNIDDNWLIRRYNPKSSSYDDSGHLMSGDIMCLFHIRTNKPALYSHAVLLGDGSQEVSCHGDGIEENNKWRVELID